MLTKYRINDTVRQQLAYDLGCDVALLEQNRTNVIKCVPHENHRTYGVYENFFRVIVTARSCVISSINDKMVQWAQKTFAPDNFAWVFDAPALRQIQSKLAEHGYHSHGLRLFYLPLESSHAEILAPEISLRWFEPEDLAAFEGNPHFKNALGFDPNAPDMMAVAAYENDTLLGMAGASADCDTMWQIGIDILPEHRGKGLASSLVSLLRQAIIEKGKIPFYGTAPSHIGSQLVASCCGFVPAWAELVVRKDEVEK